MKRVVYVAFLLSLTLALISACSPATSEPSAAMTEEAPRDVSKEAEVERTVEVMATSVPLDEAQNGHALASGNPGPNRLIIKNAEMELKVEETDQALDLVTQMVSDVGGYIVSSRVWYIEYQDEQYKQVSLTMGVPVDQFEVALRRLRNIAIQVVDETASGQDVTDEYVDLESRLRNLQATRDRIREFLDDADSVEEALAVNEQLTEVEDEIEQVQGRMNYLFDRASYSTITLLMAQDYAAIPTFTPTPSATPSPTPTLESYRAVAVAQEAGYTLMQVLRGLLTLLIWLVILLGPFALVIAGVWYLTIRLGRKGRFTGLRKRASSSGGDSNHAEDNE